MAGDLMINEFPTFVGSDSVTAAADGIRAVHCYGRLRIMAAPATVDSDVLAAASVGACTGAPSDVTAVERLGLEGLQLRESRRYLEAKRTRPRDGARWDLPCCDAAPAMSSTGSPMARSASPSPTSATSGVLQGSVSVGVVIVQGPTPALRFNPAEVVHLVAEVQNGLGFFAMSNPAADLTFTYDVQEVPVSATPQPTAPDLEQVWRDPAMAAMGFADVDGVDAYVEHLRNRFGTRWTFAAFFTKYPVDRVADASLGGPTLVIDGAERGWGPQNVDRIFAHLTGHVFGCPGEEAPSDDGEQARCLMNANTFRLCEHAAHRLGWSPRRALVAFGDRVGGWRIDEHPRFAVDTIGDGRADLVGFGNRGVWISRARSNGIYTAPELAVANFGRDAGGWRVDQHVRFLADTNGDGRADVVGFGSSGVWISHAGADGTFSEPFLAVADFGSLAGRWRVDRHPRFVADTTGDGRADIVGFGNEGVWVSRAQSDGSYGAPYLAVQEFGFADSAGGWRIDRHPRFVADTTGDGRADIVGFGDEGVWVSRAQSDGTFTDPQLAIADFGHDAGGWRVGDHLRFVVDLTGDGRADIVGFGDDGVWVSPARRDGSFGSPRLVVDDFGTRAGGWRVDRHPRFLADVTGDGRLDIVGFHETGVWVARALGRGRFEASDVVAESFIGPPGGWRVDQHPLVLADTTGDGHADVIGFGTDGVWIMGFPAAFAG